MFSQRRASTRRAVYWAGVIAVWPTPIVAFDLYVLDDEAGAA